MPEWPHASDYSEALQNPRVAFKDPALQACTVTCQPNSKQPKVFGKGKFAVVYQAHVSGQKKAIRAFTTCREGVQERYEEINKHLATLNLPCLLGCQYLPKGKGIRATVEGKLQSYPLLTMDWADGVPLYDWTADRCRKRETGRLRQAADQWKWLVECLADAQLAHGDLQHGNVHVDELDQFRLVDYDGMCVPSLIGEPAIECGLPPYQHRERDANTALSLAIDNFSTIFIYVALRALAVHPELWGEFVDATKYDALLFKPEDFNNPCASPVYQRLQASTDPDLPKLGKALFDLYLGPIQDVPPLKEVLFSYDSVRVLLDQKLFDEAVALVKRQNSTRKVPQDLVPRLENAHQRIARRIALQAEVEAGNERAMKDLYDADLLDDYDAAAADAATARSAVDVIPILENLEQAGQLRHYRERQKIWDDHKDLLEDRKSARSFRAEVEKWRPANQACTTVLRLLDQTACDPDQLRAAMRSLQSSGHPEIDGPVRQKVDRVLARAAAWKEVQAALASSAGMSEQADQKLLDTWDDSLFVGWPPADGGRPKFAAAQQRRQILVELGQLLLKIASPTQQTEQEICRLAAQLPDGYQFSHGPRVLKAKRRLELADQALEAAQREDDLALASHWSELLALAGQALLDAATQARAVLAQDRRNAWSAFRTAPDAAAANPGEASDTALIVQWNEDLFFGWPIAEQQRAAVDQARQRKEILSRLGLLSAGAGPVELSVEHEICELAARLPAGYRHATKPRVDRARQRIEALQRVQRAVQGGGEEEPIVAAWKAVDDCGACEAVDPACRQRVELAKQRVELWQRIAAALKELEVNPGEKAEAKLLQLWDDPVLRDWKRAEACRPRLAAAQENVLILRQLRQAVEKQPTPQGEEEICRLAACLPQKYAYVDQLRAGQARRRLDAYIRLAQRLRVGRPEAAIRDAAEALDEVEGMDLLNEEARQRVEVARRRTPIIRVLEGLAPTLPAEKYDQQILDVWDEDLLGGCTETDPWEPDYRLACRRRDLVERLDAALARSDEPAIGEIIFEPDLVDYSSHLDRSRPKVAEVRRNTLKSRELLCTIEKNQRDAFRERFDARVIRRCQYLFTFVFDTLVKWTCEQILPLERMNLCGESGRDSITPNAKNTYQVRWGLPDPRFAEEFEVGVTPQRLGRQSDPQSLESMIHWNSISEDDYFRRGCTVYWNGDEPGFVYVRAVVNLGFCKLKSPPLELGPTRAR